MKASSTDPTGDVWDCLALGIHDSGHNMGGSLEVENGLCGCVERIVISFVCVRPLGNYRSKTSMASRAHLCLLQHSAQGREANC